MQRVYIDTAIWRDYFEDRKDTKQELGKITDKLLKKLLKESFVIVVSNIVRRELLHKYTLEELESLFLPFKQNFVEVESTVDEYYDAHRMSMKYDVPFGDALHAVLARNHDALILTRDSDFKRLRGVCPFQKPEDFV